MKLPMPAAVLAGGASRRMGVSKAALPYGRTTLLAHQAERLASRFAEVLVVAKEPPAFDAGPARVVLDAAPDHAAIHGLAAALRETADHVFVLAVDLPLLVMPVIEEIARRALASDASALVPRAEGRLQPLAAVWRRSALPEAVRRIARGELSLHALAAAVGAEVLEEGDWLPLDPSGNSFANLNTLDEYAAARERG